MCQTSLHAADQFVNITAQHHIVRNMKWNTSVERKLCKRNIQLSLQNVLHGVQCCLLLGGWFCSGISTLLIQKNPLFVLLVFFLLQLLPSLLQQFLLHILGHIWAGSNTMSLFPRQMGTRSCRSLPALAQITNVFAVVVLPSFTGFCSRVRCEMLPRQANATWCHFRNLQKVKRRTTSEGCLEILTGPPLVACHLQVSLRSHRVWTAVWIWVAWPRGCGCETFDFGAG